MLHHNNNYKSSLKQLVGGRYRPHRHPVTKLFCIFIKLYFLITNKILLGLGVTGQHLLKKRDSGYVTFMSFALQILEHGSLRAFFNLFCSFKTNFRFQIRICFANILYIPECGFALQSLVCGETPYKSLILRSRKPDADTARNYTSSVPT